MRTQNSRFETVYLRVGWKAETRFGSSGMSGTTLPPSSRLLKVMAVRSVSGSKGPALLAPLILEVVECPDETALERCSRGVSLNPGKLGAEVLLAGRDRGVFQERVGPAGFEEALRGEDGGWR
jgi:hypothetical protein